MQEANWQKLWLGGFCAPGIYGSPIRAADAIPKPTLTQRLLRPPQAVDNKSLRNLHDDTSKIRDGWSHALGGRPVCIARSLEEARLQLLRSFGLGSREPVVVPANATHPLVEAVKQAGAKPLFAELDANLDLAIEPVNEAESRIVWLQPLLGLPAQSPISAEIRVLDHGDTLPCHKLSGSRDVNRVRADVELYGLHLAHAPHRAGALIVFNREDLYARYLMENEEVEPLVYQQAGEQLHRWSEIAPAQTAALNFVWSGLQEAAGLPLLPLTKGAALAHGVAVQVPDEGSPGLFWSYAKRENTPIQWVPEIRPIHYAAYAATASHPSTVAASTARLERWLFVPVSPEDETAFLKQAILGVVKTAEYLGLRWRTDPVRAAQYAAKLDEVYGPEHDAYRPAFPTPDNVDAATEFSIGDFLTQACSSGVPASLDTDLETESLQITSR